MAEELTGWSHDDARGQDLESVFNIINQQSRLRVDNPVTRVIREGKIIGLANHTVLIAKDGTERQIADSGAPHPGFGRNDHRSGSCLQGYDKGVRHSAASIRKSESTDTFKQYSDRHSRHQSFNHPGE